MKATRNTTRPASTLTRSMLFAAVTVGVGLSTPISLRAESAMPATRAAETASTVASKSLTPADIDGFVAELATHYGTPTESTDVSSRATDWLRDRLPFDAQGQAAVLSRFIVSIAITQPRQARGLLTSLHSQYGASHRRAVITALQAGSHPDRDLYSALLSWRDTGDGDEAANVAKVNRYLQAALASHPDDSKTLVAAATLGNFPEAAAHLTRIAPQNMFHWFPSLRSQDASAAAAALHQAAQQEIFNDYSDELQATYSTAIEASGVNAPAVLADAALAVAPNDDAEATLARIDAVNTPLLRLPHLMKLCGTFSATPPVATVRADCLIVGTAMARSPFGSGSRVMGASTVMPLAHGTPLADELQRVQDLYQYLNAMEATLSATQRNSYSNRSFVTDVAKLGEFAARQRRLAHFGIASEPPVNSQPVGIAQPSAATTTSTAQRR